MLTSVVTGAGQAQAAPGVELTTLQVEKKAEPVGIDVERPRFSWVIDTPLRAVVQQDYRITLATSVAALDSNDLIWDSGVVVSDASSSVEYAGPALEPDTDYHWNVQVTTSAGTGSARSVLRTGLYADTDWAGAAWIGNERAQGPEKDGTTVAGSSWIWTQEDGAPYAPGDPRAFRRVVEAPAGLDATRAEIVLTADDSFRLHVNGKLIGETEGAENEWQQSRRYEVDLAAKQNVFAVRTTNGGNTPPA